jgi:hypothetical protein
LDLDLPYTFEEEKEISTGLFGDLGAVEGCCGCHIMGCGLSFGEEKGKMRRHGDGVHGGLVHVRLMLRW